MRGNTFEWRDREQGEQGLATAAGRPVRVGCESGHTCGIRLLRRTGRQTRHAAARFSVDCAIASIVGIVGIAVHEIVYPAIAGRHTADGRGMAFRHYRMRGRGNGMRVFRVDL